MSSSLLQRMVRARLLAAAAPRSAPSRDVGPALAAMALHPPAAPPPTPVPVRRATTTEIGAILEEPRREVRGGIFKVLVNVITGLSIGAWMSQKMAAFLEENELFVPDDDDDDDDD